MRCTSSATSDVMLIVTPSPAFTLIRPVSPVMFPPAYVTLIVFDAAGDGAAEVGEAGGEMDGDADGRAPFGAGCA